MLLLLEIRVFFQGWTDNEIFNKIKVDHKRIKKSSLALPQVKRDDDLVGSDQQNKENIKPSNIEKLPDIKQTNSVNDSPEETRKTSAEKEKKEVVLLMQENLKSVVRRRTNLLKGYLTGKGYIVLFLKM